MTFVYMDTSKQEEKWESRRGRRRRRWGRERERERERGGGTDCISEYILAITQRRRLTDHIKVM